MTRYFKAIFYCMLTWSPLVMAELKQVPPGEKGIANGILGPAPYDPQFRLEIRDPKTNTLLWTFTEHAEWAVLQNNRDKNFEQALSRIVSDLQDLAVADNNTNKP